MRERMEKRDSGDGRREPTVIRNRDIPLLADILCVMQEVALIEQRREWQRERMDNISAHLTGMPGGGSAPTGLDDAFAKLSEIDAEHEKQCREYAGKMKTAEKLLNGIPTEEMKTFVLMKYVFDLPDAEIREKLNMTRRSFEKAKQAVEDAPDMRSVRWQPKYAIAAK